MKDEIEYMRSHPPRCMSGIAMDVNKRHRSFAKGIVGNDTTSFSTICTCGNNKFIINKPVEVGITTIICNACQKNYVLFDPSNHGYDGELGNNAELKFGEIERHKCPKCNQEMANVAVTFQYSGETDILEEDDSIGIFPEDLFGYILITAICKGCENCSVVTECECA